MSSSELVERVVRAIDVDIEHLDIQKGLATNYDVARAAITACLEALAERADAEYLMTERFTTEWDDVTVASWLRAIAAEITSAAAGTSDATEAGR